MAPEKLELSTLAPARTALSIDGQDYYLKTGSDYGLLDQKRLERLLPVIQEFTDLADDSLSTDDVMDRMSTALVELIELVLIDCPKAVSDGLNDVSRMKVAVLFTQVLTAEMEPTPKTRKPRNLKNRQTSAT